MKKLINKILKKFHKCNYSKIIASQYWTFNCRKIVVECECGRRNIEKWHYDLVYPFLTNNFITNKEMENLKNKIC